MPGINPKQQASEPRQNNCGKARNTAAGIDFCFKVHQALEKVWQEGKEVGMGECCFYWIHMNEKHMFGKPDFCTKYQ